MLDLADVRKSFSAPFPFAVGKILGMNEKSLQADPRLGVIVCPLPSEEVLRRVSRILDSRVADARGTGQIPRTVGKILDDKSFQLGIRNATTGIPLTLRATVMDHPGSGCHIKYKMDWASYRFQTVLLCIAVILIFALVVTVKPSKLIPTQFMIVYEIVGFTLVLWLSRRQLFDRSPAEQLAALLQKAGGIGESES